MLKYFNGTTASVCKGSIGGWFGRNRGFPSWSEPDCAGQSGLASVFPIIFVSYLNDLLSEALSST